MPGRSIPGFLLQPGSRYSATRNGVQLGNGLSSCRLCMPRNSTVPSIYGWPGRENVSRAPQQTGGRHSKPAVHRRTHLATNGPAIRPRSKNKARYTRWGKLHLSQSVKAKIYSPSFLGCCAYNGGTSTTCCWNSILSGKNMKIACHWLISLAEARMNNPTWPICNIERGLREGISAACIFSPAHKVKQERCRYTRWLLAGAG